MSKEQYKPSQKVLEKYAKLMVNLAVNKGKGVKSGDTVRLSGEESAKPLFIAIAKELYRSGANVVMNYIPSDDFETNLSKDFYKLASDNQLDFYPKHLSEGMVAQIDHQISIISEVNKKALFGVDPKKIMRRQTAMRKTRELLVKKENQNKFSWTLCLYGTEEMAKEAKMTSKEYWQEIIKACYLDKPNPVSVWKGIQKNIETTAKKLNSLKIETLNIKSKNIDLNIKIGKNRRWLFSHGENIPSFEIFISPDWRGTEGLIKFTEPLYRYGNLITGIELEFKNGKVIKSKAKSGEKVLKEMIASKNADKVGEFSLTDKKFSRITRFMAETLFDENVGGKYGNTHIALGNAYQDSFTGDSSKVTDKEWDKMGYNKSVVHTDIVSTEDRVVTAKLQNGKEKIIYKNGEFTL